MGLQTMHGIRGIGFAGIISMFATFAIVLAWADFYTQRGRKPTRTEVPPVMELVPTKHNEQRAA